MRIAAICHDRRHKIIDRYIAVIKRKLPQRKKQQNDGENASAHKHSS